MCNAQVNINQNGCGNWASSQKKGGFIYTVLFLSVDQQLPMKVLILFTLLATFILFGETTSKQHYRIVPVKSSHLCQQYPAGSCLTLDQLSSQLNVTGDITLSFLPGDHLLTWDLSISGANNVTFSNENNSLSPPRIHCLEDKRIAINYTSLFTMQGLVISGCKTLTGTESPVCVNRTAARIHNCNFTNNSAKVAGGALQVRNSPINITDTSFVSNFGPESGGAVDSWGSQLIIMRSSFINNTAKYGGGIHIGGGYSLLFEYVNFWNNQAKFGAAVHGNGNVTTFINCNFTNNREGQGAVYTSNLLTFKESNIFSGNNRGIYAENSHISFGGRTQFINNTCNGDGGAIWSYESTITFEPSSKIFIYGNFAVMHGGGIYLIECTLSSFGDILITENAAEMSGGGIYAFHSSIRISENPLEGLGNFHIHHNTAKYDGGGVYLFASLVRISGEFSICGNLADHYGGGMFLKSNSLITIENVNIDKVYFHLKYNSAVKGGGVYIVDVDDSQCLKNNLCLLQISLLYTSGIFNNISESPPLISFVNNTATETGSDLYGGLLDRCTAYLFGPHSGLQFLQIYSSFNWAPHKQRVVFSDNDVKYYGRVTNVSEFYNHISSDTVRVCFCEDDIIDCSSTPPCVFKKKGEGFTLSLIATDQVGKPLNATIISSLKSEIGEIGGLKAGQQYRQIGDRCTKLEFNIYSSGTKAAVEIYADGPCENQGFSKQEVNITFLPCVCPVGFERVPSDIDCSCDCDKRLTHYISNCSTENETIQVNKNVWIKYINFTNSTSEYITHGCPFGYCVDKPVTLSLADQDAQCAFNRTGTLCGECDEGFSLVFASSECQQCSNYYLFLLLPFAVAGIALVAFILILNMTVATGTIHGLIFYANILAANRSIFSPFDTPNFLTVFISWLNLDLGIQTCFYSGMDSYGKAMLQLVFPIYVFLLIAIIIVLCEYSQRFASLLGKKNPEATLYTLVLLSYSKLIRLIITALQFTTISYPDDTKDTVWLYDANVLYFTASHIPRFIAAIIITLLGTVYTTLLLFGQLFNRCSEYRVMKWTTHKYYIHFMKAHHAPLSDKHRYWVGLLLLARLAHYIISAFMTDYAVITSASFLAFLLILYKQLIGRIYGTRWLDSLESLFLVNLNVLGVATLLVRYRYVTNGNQQALAIVSMSVTFIAFSALVLYHILRSCGVRPGDVLSRQVVMSRRRSYQCIPSREIDKDDKFEDEPLTDDGDTQNENAPGHYSSLPIRFTVPDDQLREPALDDLIPVRPEDYAQCGIAQAPQQQVRQLVTYAEVDIGHKKTHT